MDLELTIPYNGLFLFATGFSLVTGGYLAYRFWKWILP